MQYLQIRLHFVYWGVEAIEAQSLFIFRRLVLLDKQITFLQY